MKRQRRHHSPEFKREAVALVVEHGYSCMAAGRSLGVNGTLIGRWKDELEDHEAAPFLAKGNVSPSSSVSMNSNQRTAGCGWSEKS